ncbi:MAG: hypothetical protein KDD64_13955 [Bdellovibrionales bacterium]|nr:hypothetical protein [Bdellovibrionales bacterium]
MKSRSSTGASTLEYVLIAAFLSIVAFQACDDLAWSNYDSVCRASNGMGTETERSPRTFKRMTNRPDGSVNQSGGAVDNRCPSNIGAVGGCDDKVDLVCDELRNLWEWNEGYEDEGLGAKNGGGLSFAS